MPRGVRSMLPALILALAGTVTATTAWAQDASPAVGVLRSAHSGRARARAADAIGRTRPQGGRQALETALNDRDAHVRQSAAGALGAYGDAAAMPALLAHGDDRDGHVRDAVTRAVTDLRAHAPTAQGSPRGTAGAPPTIGVVRPVVSGGRSSGMVLPTEVLSVEVPRSPVDWRRVRYVVGIGPVVNQAREAAPFTPVVRAAIEHELTGRPGMAPLPDALPPEVAARMRTGAVRRYSLEGGVTTLRRVQMPAAAAMRAEVSLLLIAEPAHAIVGTIAGAATAQEPVVPGTPPTRDDRLTTHAIQAAVRSALANIERSLATFHGH